MRRLRRIAVLLVLLASRAAAASAQPEIGTITGTVTDQTGAALPGATVTVTAQASAIVSSVTTGADGAYRIEAAPAGRFGVSVALMNFATVRREIVVGPGATVTHDVSLPLALSADVVVTGQRSFNNIADVVGIGGRLVGIADSASEGVVTAAQVQQRPLLRAGEVLETVPGLVISQHSGEGKANQYYLRGFNLDHGTDFATTVAGVPVNMPTHAHGHGYADLNFLIPELVSGVQYRKGPYFAEEGDFSTAGASHIRYANALERPMVRVSGGEDGWARALAAASPRLGPGRLLVAAELTHNDGPWVRGDDYRRLNGVARYSVGDSLNAWSVTAMGYDGTWRATDQAPQRAVAAGLLSRFDGVDDSGGGSSTRLSLSADWQRTRAGQATRANAYVMSYELDLFSNFTYFLDDPENGDQFQQSDRRVVSGGRLSHRIASRLAGRQAEWLFGADLRHDAISRVALFDTVRRQPIGVTRDDRVAQTSVAGYVQHEVQWTNWARSIAGVRVDRFQFDVTAREAENSGRTDAALASPKASLVLGPWRSAELYVNGGFGYHSNDARGTTLTIDPSSGDPASRVTPLARAQGAEVGARLLPIPNVEMDVALWRLDLDSELVFVGDAGATTASRPSRRWGVEWNTYARLGSWVTADADLSWSRARFTHADEAGRFIPGAVERVTSAGVTVDGGGRPFGSLRLRYFGPRNLVEDGSVRSAATRLLNGQAGVRLTPSTDVVLDAFNLLDEEASDIDYFYTSRLENEPAEGVDDLHTHPTLPRTLRLSVRWKF